MVLNCNLCWIKTVAFVGSVKSINKNKTNNWIELYPANYPNKTSNKRHLFETVHNTGSLEF